MQIVTLSVQSDDVKEKVIWFLEHLRDEGVEILDSGDAEDLKLLQATRSENTVSFSEYLNNED